MQLYSGTSEQLIQSSARNQIADSLKSAFFAYFGYEPPQSEVRSWQNSLRAISQVFQLEKLTDHGVLLEYQLPLSSRRLDCMVTGQNHDKQDNAVIIELKQWESCEPSDGENEVCTWLGGARRDVLHPSAQVIQYRDFLIDGHTSFYEADPIQLNACSYLHNYRTVPDDYLFDGKFSELIAQAPVFDMDNTEQLGEYLRRRLDRGNGVDILARIEQGRFRPSRKGNRGTVYLFPCTSIRWACTLRK